MGEIVKICDIHGPLTAAQTLQKKEYRPPYYVYVRCKECEHKRNREQYIKHQEKRRAYARQYHAEHREACNAKKKAWREANPTRVKRTKAEWDRVKKDVVKAHNKRQVEELTDAYIRSLLAKTSKNLTNKDVNIPALIEVKRVSLLLKRNLRSQRSG